MLDGERPMKRRMSASLTPSHSPSLQHKDIASIARASSPVPPLAPLAYLQNQRRGSITDPSLHAAHPGPKPSLSQFHRPHAPVASSGLYESYTDPRPSSPYVFGDATAQSSESNLQIRKLLRSPSLDREKVRSSSAKPERGSPRPSPRSRNGDDDMHVDPEPPNRLRHFNYGMRRHSIAADPISNPLQGTKRKMSSDRGAFPAVGEEIDPQLAGPGVSSSMDMDTEAPAPKRRGSAFDTQRIAQLSLNDRRNSVDSRGPNWWVNDRRDSASSAFSGALSYTSAISGSDSPRGRPPPSIATFAWPSSSHPPDSTMQHDGDGGPYPSRQFDPPVSMMPPISFPPDRRMSSSDPLTASGPTRMLRSRSRPPSRQMRASSDQHQTHSSTSSGQEDHQSTPSPTSGNKSSKESAMAPYSRSPELRVSHKLAERKRRKEMKDLFDELRDQLPADRGMKASKWEILSKAIEFVGQLKQSHEDMGREISILRHELDVVRQGNIPPFSGAPVYSQGGQHSQYQHSQQITPHSRPSSSQNVFPPGASQNGNRPDILPT